MSPALSSSPVGRDTRGSQPRNSCRITVGLSLGLFVPALALLGSAASAAPGTATPTPSAPSAPKGTAPAGTPPTETVPATDTPAATQQDGTTTSATPKTDDTTPAEPVEKTITVTVERSTSLLGKANSASQGTVGPRQLQERPILRPGELLEVVPGLIITQHSGSGKANQYFLRGYNLDHGTDLATFVDGMPINMPTHGHGQGYTDLNFLIPELVSGISYRKGAYSADQGDFSSAGTVSLAYARALQKGTSLAPTQELGLGDFSYQRALITRSSTLRNGNLVYGLELFHNDGPWERGDNYRKINGVLRYSHGTERNGFTLTGMGYHGDWNSTDQIPLRAVNSGLIGRFGAIDPSDGGKSYRYSLSSQWQHLGTKSETRANAYAIRYKLNLFSDFTYFLDHPEAPAGGVLPEGQTHVGDQFEQADKRTVLGFQTSHQWNSVIGKRPMSNTIGLQVRHDDIGGVGLYSTEDRQRYETVRQDRVQETSIAPYFENRIRWTPTIRSTLGIRYDNYRFKVASSIAANSGKARDSLVSPKFGLVFGPFKNTELYFNLARGFHSNDARGTTITVDPGDPNVPAERVTPLVPANLAEIGVRSTRIRNLQSTLALWYLKSASELVFVGDAGTTEPSYPSRRTGIEFTNFYTPTRNLTLDADFGLSRARFVGNPDGSSIPGAIEGVIAAGISYEPIQQGMFGSLRLRYFGPRPLIEDNSVRSSSSTLINARVGYKQSNGLRLALEVFNVFNTRVSDIDYYYTSRLPGEPAEGVNDIHFHPAESRSFRLVATRGF